jgi:hypothetical protein
MCVMGTYIDSFVSVPMIFLLNFETVLTVWQFSFYDLKCWRHHQCILAYPYMLNNCGGPCYSQFKSSGLSFFVVFLLLLSSSCILYLMFSMSLKCRFLIAPRFFLMFTQPLLAYFYLLSTVYYYYFWNDGLSKFRKLHIYQIFYVCQ